MKWEQIERQWAAMTRRVQCDWSAAAATDLNRPDEIISARSVSSTPDARPPGAPQRASRRPESGATRAE